jgi:hypothetical protein
MLNVKLSGILLFPFLSLFLAAQAQISTVSGFNYYDINNSTFTVDASCFGLNASETEEYEYRFTSIQLANSLTSVFNAPADSLDQVVGDYIFMKRTFLNQSLGGEDFRYIMLRPNDNVVRPVILITHGGQSGGAGALRTLSLGIYDYVQRGYAVVYYQSGTATGDAVQALTDVGFTNACQYSWSPDETMDCFQQAVYVKYQFAVAAKDYTTANKSNLNIDENLLFASGFSGGALGTLYLALTDPGDFSDPMFSGMGGFNNLSRYPTENGEIIGVATLGGGVIDPSSSDYKIGSLVDASDQNTRFLMLHGQDDYAVQPETNPLQWSDPNLELPGSQLAGSMSLDAILKANNIASKAVINCSACHNIFTWPCDYTDDCFGNNPLFDLPCVLWTPASNYTSINFSNLCDATNDQSNWTEIFYVLDQIHDYAKITSAFLHEDFPDTGPARIPDTFIDSVYNNDQVFALNPIDFPFNEGSGDTNGHFISSTKCLAQTCSALYFNELGNSNLLGTNYKGDYLTMTGLAQNTFNNDFTLELQIKAIDQGGIGTLFSHIDNLTFGFEVIINGNGFVQFRKNNLGGQGAITGSTSVLDNSCHTISVTREGNQFGLYVDGVLQESKKSYNINFANAIESRVGNTLNEFITDRGFNGIIRNIVLWDAPISNFGQVSIPTTQSNLVAEWQLDQGVGQSFTSTDSSFPIHLGTNTTNAAFDPRWMNDDEICYCTSDPVVGLSEMHYTAVDNEFLVVPNPNSGKFEIQLSENISYPASATFYTLEGTLVRQLTIHNNSIELSGFNEGLYFIHLQYDDKKSIRKMIVR